MPNESVWVIFTLIKILPRSTPQLICTQIRILLNKRIGRNNSVNEQLVLRLIVGYIIVTMNITSLHT